MASSSSSSSFIYVVLQSGEVYPSAYTTYENALASVQEKNKELLEGSEHLTEGGARLEGRYSTEFDASLEENVETGITYLYIEYGKIIIQIHRLPIAFALKC
jgi:hypothetical protein